MCGPTSNACESEVSVLRLMIKPRRYSGHMRTSLYFSCFRTSVIRRAHISNEDEDKQVINERFMPSASMFCRNRLQVKRACRGSCLTTRTISDKCTPWWDVIVRLLIGAYAGSRMISRAPHVRIYFVGPTLFTIVKIRGVSCLALEKWGPNR